MQNPPPNQQNYGTPYGTPTNDPLTTPPGGGPGGGKTSMGIDSNIAAMLCYLTMFVCGLGIILSLVFFLVEKTNRFVRFHAMQALLLVGANIALGVALSVLGGILAFANLGFLAFALQMLVGLGFLVLFVLCAIKAYSGEWYKVPFIGDIAENIAGK